MRRPVLAVLSALLLLLIAFLLLVLLPPWPVTDSLPLDPPPAVPPPRADPAPEPPPPAIVPDRKTDEPPVSAEAKAAFRIHGRVVDGRGTGVAGADLEIRAWSGDGPEVQWTVYRARTTEEGAFSVPADRARASRGFGFETAADGCLEGWVSLKFEDYDEQRGVGIAVEPGRSIVGRVIDDSARPIPKTTVQLWYGSETTWPTTVDEDGRFRTPARAPRRAFELVVEAPGYPRRTVPIPAAPAEESTDVGDIAFRRGGRLAGIAVDRDGRPVPGIPLCLTGIAGNSSDSPRTRTDDGGRFEFTDVGDGVVGVCVDAPGTAPDAAGNSRSYEGGIGEVAVGRTDLKVILAARTTLTLRFVDAATGQPILLTSTKSGAWPSGTADQDAPYRGSSSSTPFGVERMMVPSGARCDVLLRSPGFEDARLAGLDVPDVAEMTVDVPMRRSR